MVYTTPRGSELPGVYFSPPGRSLGPAYQGGESPSFLSVLALEIAVSFFLGKQNVLVYFKVGFGG
ncbi:hypothetical protein ES703_93012 [subsurface metagenome]